MALSQNPNIPLTEPTNREVLTIRLVIHIVIGLIIAGVALWLIDTYIPMAGSIKAILNFVVVIAACVMVLQAVGLWEPIARMGRKLTDKAERSAD